MLCRLISAVSLLMLGAMVCLADPPAVSPVAGPAAAPADPAQVEQALANVQRYENAGQDRQARLAAEEALRLAETCRDVNLLIRSLVVVQQRQLEEGDLAAAIKSVDRLIELLVAQSGPQHWRSRSAALQRKHLADLQDCSEQDRARLVSAERDLSRGTRLLQAGDLKQAGVLLRRCYDIWAKEYGPEHPSTAAAGRHLAVVLQKQNEPEQAEQLCRAALDVYLESYGQEHPSLESILDTLLNLLSHKREQAEQSGDLTLAAAIAAEALQASRRVFPDQAFLVMQCRYQLIRLQRLIDPLPEAAFQPVTIFEDRFFEPDSLAGYQIEGDVRQENDRLFLGTCRMTRSCPADSSVTVNLFVESLALDQEAASPGQSTDGLPLAEAPLPGFRWGLAMEGQRQVWCEVIRGASRGQTAHRLRVRIDTVDAAGQPVSDVVQEVPVRGGTITGLWQARDHFGLLEVRHDGELLLSFQPDGPSLNQVTDVMLEVTGLELTLRSLSASGIAILPMSEDVELLRQASNGVAQLERSASDQGEYARALQWRQIVHQYDAVIHGEGHERFAKSCNALGYHLQSLQQYAEAREYFERALEIRRRVLGENHEETAVSWNNLGYLTMASGGPMEFAISCYERAHRVLVAVKGEDHKQSLTTLRNLGLTYHQQGESEVGREYLQQALEISRRSFGTRSLEASQSVSALSLVLLETGRHQEARQLLADSLEIADAEWGREHPQTCQLRLLSARVALTQDELFEAQEFSLAVFNDTANRLGLSHPFTQSARGLLEQTLERFYDRFLAEGDFFELLRVVTVQKQLRDACHGTDSRQAMESQSRLEEFSRLQTEAQQSRYQEGLVALQRGRTLLEEKQFPAALDALKTALSALDESGVNPSRDQGECLCLIATCAAALGETAAAAENIHAGYELLKSRIGAVQPLVISALSDIVILQLSTDEYAAALATMQRVEEDCEKLDDVATEVRQKLMERWLEPLADFVQRQQAREDWLQVLEASALRASLAMQCFGPDHWRTRDCQQQHARLLWLSEQPPEILEAQQELKSLQQQLLQIEREQRWPELVASARELQERSGRVFGADSREYAEAGVRLGSAQLQSGLYLDAAATFSEAVPLLRVQTGEIHPALAEAIGTWGSAEMQAGHLPAAMERLRTAIRIFRELNETKSLRYATQLNNLAVCYHLSQDDRSAVPLYQECLDLLRQEQGEVTAEYAMGLDNLASAYHSIGDGRTEETRSRAEELLRAVFGEEHPEYLKILNLRAQDLARSDLSAAEAIYQQCERIQESRLGPDHPDTLLTCARLALCLSARGDHPAAIRTLQDCSRQLLALQGELHPSYSDFQTWLSMVLAKAGQRDEALDAQWAALQATEQRWNVVAATQSEQQQLQLYEHSLSALHRLLALTADRPEATDAVYQEVLTWKGNVFLRQRSRRELFEDPEYQPVINELSEVSHQLAALSTLQAESTPASLEKRRRELSARKEQLEVRLAAAAAEQDKVHDIKPTLSRVQAALPEDAVLVDYFLYIGNAPLPDSEAEEISSTDPRLQLAAFVVRRDAPVIRFELGPAAPLADRLHDWRREIVRGGGSLRGLVLDVEEHADETSSPAQELAEGLWRPLEPALGGAVRILISPDQFLNRLPFAALPGLDPERYLLEERQLTFVPSASVLCELSETSTTDRQAELSLLLVGDVDFSAPLQASLLTDEELALPSSALRSGERLASFAPLPGTSREVAAIETIHRKAFPDRNFRNLSRTEADESTLRRYAGRSRVLHLATHGFFAPIQQEAVASEQGRGSAVLPGLQSGIALAGANRRLDFSLANPRQENNGILTATEVAELDLRQTELVVLSACETGLGQITGGEGLLGLQRALHLAGARSVVASLWHVDDEATQILMTEFYRLLWEEHLPRGEALRQAQLKLLRGELPVPSARFGKELKGSLPPRYWAAFTLSGDSGPIE